MKESTLIVLHVIEYSSVELHTLARMIQELEGPDLGVDLEGPAKEVARLLDLAEVAPRYLPRSRNDQFRQRQLDEIEKDVQDLLAGQYPNVEVVYVEDQFGLWRREVRVKLLTTP